MSTKKVLKQANELYARAIQYNQRGLYRELPTVDCCGSEEVTTTRHTETYPETGFHTDSVSSVRISSLILLDGLLDHICGTPEGAIENPREIFPEKTHCEELGATENRDQ